MRVAEALGSIAVSMIWGTGTALKRLYWPTVRLLFLRVGTWQAVMDAVAQRLTVGALATVVDGAMRHARR